MNNGDIYEGEFNADQKHGKGTYWIKKTEKDILDTLSYIDKENNVFVISHKKSTLSFCDKIIEI